MLAWLWTRLSEGGPQVSISGRALRRFPGPAIDRLLRARVLIEQRKVASWSVCSHCDCGLDARPIREVGVEIRACCPHDAAEDLVLEEQDLKRFSIDPDRLARQIAASGGLVGGVDRICDGMWLIGIASSGVAVALCSDPERLEAPGTLLAIKAIVGHRPVTVMATEFESAQVIRLQEAGVDGRQIGECLNATGTDRERLMLDGSVRAAAAPRLVLSTGNQMAMLDNRRLNLPPQMYALFRLLAEQTRQRDQVLKKQAIEAKTGRPANEILRDLRRTLVGCGLTREKAAVLVVTVRGYGYRLGLDPAEVAIED